MNTNTNVKKLIQQYAAAEHAKTIDLDSVPFKHRPAMEMAKRQAEAQMNEVKEQYAKFIHEGAFTIFLNGAKADVEAWASVAVKEAGALVIRADALYQNIADDIEPSIGDRRTFGTTQLGLLVSALTNIGKQFDARNIPLPQINDLAHCADRDALVGLIRKLVRSVVGDVLNQKWMERDLLSEALKIRYILPVVPVIVVNSDPEEATSLSAALFSGTTFTVKVTPEGTSEESVIKTLTDIQKNKSKKK
jgi:hypothetical protein